jgi:hypothetical protein
MLRHLIQGNLVSKTNLEGWCLRVWFRANNAQVCADQLLGSQPDSVIVKAYSLCLFPLFTWEDSLTKKWNPDQKGVSPMSGLTFVWYSVIAKHLCVGLLLLAFLSKKVAGFGASSVVRVRLSFYKSKITSYFRIPESVSHLPNFWFKIVLTWWVVIIIRFPPKVIFLLSLVKRAVDATGWMYSGQPQMTGSRNLDKKATCWHWHPCF